LYDVVVVGGGPIGSYTASRLAEMGYEVVVLERKSKVGTGICCTGIVSQECAIAFDIDDSLILKRANSARVFSPSGNLLNLQREETQACILDRVAFDMAMAKRAIEKGAQYLPDYLVRNIEITEDKINIESFRQGERTYFEGRAAVIAAGFNSRLAERLGLGVAGDFVVGAQAEVSTMGIDEVEVYFGRELAPGFFGWLVPTSPNMARVGLMSRENPRFYLKKLITSLFEQGKVTQTEVELSFGGIPLKLLRRTYSERLIVVGDAAGQVKPTTGGGIYYGLLCADIAADTLNQALRCNDLSAKSLAKYERRWKRKLGRELKTGYWARRLFERLSDHQIDRIFGIIKANGIDKALLEADDISFDWHGKPILNLVGRAVVSKVIGRTKAMTRTSES
jgi:geranylgeranyl reductase family protein